MKPISFERLLCQK